MTYQNTDTIKQLVDEAQHMVVIQADNPDADSLGSALALENILGDSSKKVSLYCGVDIPGYLHYLEGWDRVSRDLPKQFDVSIIVDASTYTLLEKLQTSGQLGWISSKPCVVLDHHASVENQLNFAASTIYDEKSSSTGELIYHLAQQLSRPVNKNAGECLMAAILGDTQGLSNGLASAETYRVMAELVELGVDRPQLEEQRREYSKMHLDIFRYKAQLIERTEFASKGRIALVAIPQNEINEFSPLYNPGPLIQGDMLQTIGVALALVFKQYDDGKVTGAIRANLGFPVAAELATKLGGGGHSYASGFKITSGKSFDAIKSECLELATQLLDNLEPEDQRHETV